MALRGGPESRDPSPGSSLGRAFSAGANVLNRAGSAGGSSVGINKSGRRPGPNDARAPQRPAGMPTPQMAPGQVPPARCVSMEQLQTLAVMRAIMHIHARTRLVMGCNQMNASAHQAASGLLLNKACARTARVVLISNATERSSMSGSSRVTLRPCLAPAAGAGSAVEGEVRGAALRRRGYPAAGHHRRHAVADHLRGRPP